MGNYILKVINLTKIYKTRRENEIKAVNNVSFNIKNGEIVGLLGPNGAGKTTIIKMICRLINSTKGNILYENDIKQKKRLNMAKNITCVLEGNRNVYWRLTVRENLEFLSIIKGYNPKKLKERIDYYIDFFNLRDKEHVIAGKLSQGMKQKLSIAASMVPPTKIVLLDEPTLGLDVKASYDMRKILKKIAEEENRTILITTHDMKVVQNVCNRIIIINQGQIIADDKINNLLHLFELKNYHFSIEGFITDEQRQLLNDIPHLEIKENDKNTEISVHIDKMSIFYRIVRVLENGGSIVKSIENSEIDFEKAYIEILGGIV